MAVGKVYDTQLGQWVAAFTGPAGPTGPKGEPGTENLSATAPATYDSETQVIGFDDTQIGQVDGGSA